MVDDPRDRFDAAVDEEFDESTDGPDVLAAERALRQSLEHTRETEIVIRQNSETLDVIREIHRKNHFVDKLHLIMYGKPREGAA